MILIQRVLSPPHKHGPKKLVIIDKRMALVEQDGSKEEGSRNEKSLFPMVLIVYVPFNVGLVLQVFIELGDGFDLGEVGERHSLLSGRMVDEEGEA